jgi:hypothetical protein
VSRCGQGGPPFRYFFASGVSRVQVRHRAFAATASAHENEAKPHEAGKVSGYPTSRYQNAPHHMRIYENNSAQQAQMHFFGELDGHVIPLDPDPLVGGQDLGPKSGLSRGPGTDGAGRLHQNGRHQQPAQEAHRACARARYARVRGVETARAQRKPKYPKTNKTMTTAPTSQMMLFMILLCCLLSKIRCGSGWRTANWLQ